jgi:5'-deoxynucleotidase YfbR-like HD superfamily hydrolase
MILEKLLFDRDLDRLQNLRRWNGLRLNQVDTVAAHTFNVCLITRILVEEMSDGVPNPKILIEAMDYALFHDFTEIFDFDVNHEVKYNEFNGNRIRELLSEFVFNRVEEKFGRDNSHSSKMIFENCKEPLPLIKDIVKVADWFSCLIYLRKEMDCGNKGLESEYINSILKILERCDSMIESYRHSSFNLSIFEKIKNIDFYAGK